ncbi:MAG: ATP-binding protein [Polyangiaceae bacterium]
MTEAVTLDTCDREPIHIPGAIQPHGALLACYPGDELLVAQVSANLEQFCGVSAADALGRSVFELFEPASQATLRGFYGQRAQRELNPLRLLGTNQRALDAVVHQSGELLVLELEHGGGQLGGGFDPRLRQAISRLQSAPSADKLCRIAVDEVRALTGFDRVMVYRFDDDWNGEVVAEARRDDLETFLGLHYPASDIPAQARRLYTQNWLRLIADISYTPAPLQPEFEPRSGAPLDLSQAHLRSVSPIHIEYLKNMGVSASMSISLVADGELFGLIACHHYSGPRLVDFYVRESAEYLGQALSWNLRVLERADTAERARRVQALESELVRGMAGAEDLLDGLAVPAFAELTAATGAAIVLDEGVRCVGSTPDERRIGEIVAWLRNRDDDVFATDNLSAHYQPAEHWDGTAAGLLAATVSRELGEYLLWFRPSTERNVDWAGDPRKQAQPATDGAPPRLSPRGSFALWRETVRGRSLPWERWQLEAASNVRRLMIGGARRRTVALRTLNRRLLDADRAKDVFIATISHELRTPLNAIAGWSQLMVSGGLARERWNEAMQVVSRNSGTLTRLVEDLLDVSRMVSGKLELEVENVDIAGIVEQVSDAMALAAQAKDIRVKRVLGSGPVAVLGDVTRLRQVLSNLLTNAFKFTPKGGSVTITLRRQGSDVEIVVSDTGQGIDAESLLQVFTPFWQADGSAKRKSQGLGLGLAIAKKLVELHGGSLVAESGGLGHGSAFVVRLPVASARRDEPRAANEEARRTSGVLAGARVLVVEDEDDSRDLLVHIVQSAGATVRAAQSAAEALALCAAEPFDALISDIGLPEMDGLELVRALRSSSDAALRKLPAVALTAYTRAYDRTSALRAGFQAHVPKPADPDELVVVVASLLSRVEAG